MRRRLLAYFEHSTDPFGLLPLKNIGGLGQLASETHPSVYALSRRACEGRPESAVSPFIQLIRLSRFLDRNSIKDLPNRSFEGGSSIKA